MNKLLLILVVCLSEINANVPELQELVRRIRPIEADEFSCFQALEQFSHNTAMCLRTDDNGEIKVSYIDMLGLIPRIQKEYLVEHLVYFMQGATHNVQNIKCSRDSSFFVSISSRGRVTIWKLSQEGICSLLQEIPGIMCKKLHISSNNDLLILLNKAWLGYEVTIWERQSNEFFKLIQTIRNVDDVSICTDNNLLLIKHHESKELWLRGSGGQFVRLIGFPEKAQIQTSAQGTHFAIVCAQGKLIHVFFNDEQICTTELIGDTRCFAMSSDNTFIIAIHKDGIATLWRRGLDDCFIRQQTIRNCNIHNLKISPDSRYVFIEHWNKTISIWKYDNGEIVKLGALQKIIENASCARIQMSPDSSFFVVHHFNNVGTLWILSDEIFKRGVQQEYVNDVNGIKISSDSRFFVTLHFDNSARIWAPDCEKKFECIQKIQDVKHVSIDVESQILFVQKQSDDKIILFKRVQVLEHIMLLRFIEHTKKHHLPKHLVTIWDSLSERIQKMNEKRVILPDSSHGASGSGGGGHK